MELTGVIRREHACEPGIGRIVDGQRRLQTGEPLVARRKHLDGAPQLIRLRRIFGIIDNRE